MRRPIAFVIASLFVESLCEAPTARLSAQPQKPREDYWPAIPAANPDRAFTIQPNADCVTLGVPFRTNEFGFRDDPSIPKTQGVFRIVCLGDSVTFGTGVANRDTFPNVLESTLQRLSAQGQKVDVVNAAVSAYNVRNIRALLEETIDALQPDLVVYTFVENDLDDSVSAGPRGYLMALDPLKRPEEPYVSDDFPALWLMRRQAQGKTSLFDSITSLFDNQLETVSEISPPLLFGDHPTTRERWGMFESNLSQMKNLSEQRGAAFAVYSFALRNHSEPLVRKIREMCGRMGIPEASTMPIFDQATYMSRHSLGYDPHCNLEGHRLMADRLLAFLTNAGLLEKGLGIVSAPARYIETVDEAVANRFEQQALALPRTIDLEGGDGALGLLAGVDPDGSMARYCLLRLSGPGAQIAVEASPLFGATGQQQALSAEIEGEPVGPPVIVEGRSTRAVFPVPQRFQNKTVEVKLIAQGPVDLPTPDERLQGKTPRTIRLKSVTRR
jgi:hypothetical protein